MLVLDIYAIPDLFLLHTKVEQYQFSTTKYVKLILFYQQLIEILYSSMMKQHIKNTFLLQTLPFYIPIIKATSLIQLCELATTRDENLFR